MAYLEDRGQQPMKHLRELFEVFGTVRQLRLFNLLAAACVQFDNEGQAKAVSNYSADRWHQRMQPLAY